MPIFNPFKNPFMMFFPKKMLGIDIGTASVKIVELSRWGGGKTLENYGEINSPALYKESFRNMERGSYLLPDYFVARAIRAILDEARIKTKEVIFSIPDFSTFCTSFELPPMSEKEIPNAVQYTAPQYIPLPISETALDWKIIGGEPGDKRTPIKIFLVAVPRRIIEEYQSVARMAGLELYALEAEALSIARSLVKDSKKTICLLDIGVQSTTINIIEKGSLKKSYSFNFSSGQLTNAVASAMGVGYTEAEEIKSKEGLLSKNEGISRNLYLLVDPILSEVKNIVLDYYQREGKEIEEIYLSGGTAHLPGLKAYFGEVFKKDIDVPNCFSDLLYPPILEDTLEKMGPSFSVAVGAALGGLQT